MRRQQRRRRPPQQQDGPPKTMAVSSRRRREKETIMHHHHHHHHPPTLMLSVAAITTLLLSGRASMATVVPPASAATAAATPPRTTRNAATCGPLASAFALPSTSRPSLRKTGSGRRDCWSRRSLITITSSSRLNTGRTAAWYLRSPSSPRKHDLRVAGNDVSPGGWARTRRRTQQEQQPAPLLRLLRALSHRAARFSSLPSPPGTHGVGSRSFCETRLGAAGSPNLNGAGGASSPGQSATADSLEKEKGEGKGKRQQQAELTISALLSAITPDFASSSASRAGGGREGENPFPSFPFSGDKDRDGGEEGECEDLDGGLGAVEVEASVSSAVSPGADVGAQSNVIPRGKEVAVEAGQRELEVAGVAAARESWVPEDADGEEEGEGTAQERGRKRDMYKIRSLLLQGQIAGLRERLKERELDVKELRVLTGGRGQSKLRELGAMLKEAREECEALQAREKSLAEELAMSQKEGDTLRGDLLANQKALSDLNVYADSLRSRYTAEMVKLEASLAEMERELTRAEAAHMRERRELLDREAAAVADQERFRSRSILLQGEVVKTRARETNLRRENARLSETAQREAALAANASASASVSRGASITASSQQQEEDNDAASSATVQSLEEDNAALRRKLEALSSGGGAAGSAVSSSSLPPFFTAGDGGRGRGGTAGSDLPILGGGFQGEAGGRRPFLPWGRSGPDGGLSASSPRSSSVDGYGADGGGGVVVVDAVVNDSSSSSGGGVDASFEDAEGGPATAVVNDVREEGSFGAPDNASADRSNADAVDSPSGEDSTMSQTQAQAQAPPVAVGGATPSASRATEEMAKSDLEVARAAGFKGEKDAERAFREAGVNRVVEGLRAENTRLRQRLRAAEHAAQAGEDRADAEADRADDLEAELGRVRVTVRGRVKALKAALEEAEEDADRAVVEKEEFMLQWEEDVDALRRQLGVERKAREDDRRELEEAIFDLEDELDDLKEQYRQLKRKKPIAGNKKQKAFSSSSSSSPGDTSFREAKSGPSDGGVDGGDGGGGRARRRRTEQEAKERSEERSKKLLDTKKADEEWKKAMTLLQYLD